MSTWQPARPPRRSADARPVGDSLERLARRLGAPSPGVLATVFAHWEELVGAAVADHTRPVSLRDGVLTIAADQPAWATQLRLLSGELLERLTAPGTAVATGLATPTIDATTATREAAVREVRITVRPDAVGLR